MRSHVRYFEGKLEERQFEHYLTMSDEVFMLKYCSILS